MSQIKEIIPRLPISTPGGWKHSEAKISLFPNRFTYQRVLEKVGINSSVSGNLFKSTFTFFGAVNHNILRGIYKHLKLALASFSSVWLNMALIFNLWPQQSWCLALHNFLILSRSLILYFFFLASRLKKFKLIEFILWPICQIQSFCVWSFWSHISQNKLFTLHMLESTKWIVFKIMSIRRWFWRMTKIHFLT